MTSISRTKNKAVWGGVLFLCLSAALIAPYFVLAIEDIQTILFPFLVLSIFFIAKAYRIYLPKVLLLAWVFVWLVGAINIRGIYPLSRYENKIYLARFENSSDRQKEREFYNTYQELSRLYDTPSLQLMQRVIPNEAKASRWLKRNPQALAVLYGSHEWISVSFGDRLHNEVESQKSAMHDNLLKVAAGKILAINVPMIAKDLYIATAPEILYLPREPIDLSRHYLAWLTKGLKARHLSQNLNELNSALFNLEAAANVSGQWKSLSPIGLANFFIATTYLYAHSQFEYYQFADLECALHYFMRSLTQANRKQAPEIAAVTLNNAAIAKLLLAKDKETLVTAKKWLRTAVKLKRRDGSSTLGAQIALVNLARLSN